MFRDAGIQSTQKVLFLISPFFWSEHKHFLKEEFLIHCRTVNPPSGGPKLDSKFQSDASDASDAIQPLYSAHCGVHVHYHPCGGSFRAVSLSYMLQVCPRSSTAHFYHSLVRIPHITITALVRIQQKQKGWRTVIKSDVVSLRTRFRRMLKQMSL